MTYRWDNRRDGNRHTDDWLMTYADMITLLLCFFLLFLSSAVLTRKQPVPAVVQPSILAEIPELRPQQIDHPVLAKFELPFSPPPEEEEENKPVALTPEGSSVVPPVALHTEAAKPQDAKGDETLSPEPVAAPAPAEDRGGDRITIVEMDSAAFFDSGSAQLTPSGKRVLDGVFQNLSGEKFSGYRVSVEGHTDDTPIRTAQFPSNWELSTSRASAVVRYFLDKGFPGARLRASGYGDSAPKLPNRDAEGHAIPSNQAQNRRVVITMEKIDKGA